MASMSASSAPAWPRAAGQFALRWLAVVLLLVVWESVSRSGLVTRFTLPAFSLVCSRIWADLMSGELLVYMGLTLYRALTGFAIATVLGVTIGLMISRSKLAHWLFDPIISIGFPCPKIAFLPVVVLWLGFYDTAKITMIVIDSMFPVITATLAGIKGVEQQLVWSARNMGASEREILWQVLLPAAAPTVLTGIQVALPVAMIVAIIMEMMTGGVGLGGAMVTASRQADSPGVFAGLVEIAVVGLVLIKGMELIRQRLLAWHQETRTPTTV